MVGVAQMVEHFAVAEVVAGSNPVVHPKQCSFKGGKNGKHSHF